METSHTDAGSGHGARNALQPLGQNGLCLCPRQGISRNDMAKVVVDCNSKRGLARLGKTLDKFESIRPHGRRKQIRITCLPGMVWAQRSSSGGTLFDADFERLGEGI